MFKNKSSSHFSFSCLSHIAVVLVIALLLLLSCDVYDQNSNGDYTLKGRITNVDGNGIGGVEVRIDETGKKAVTASDGTYQLDGVPGTTITLSAVGDTIMVPIFNADHIMSNGNSVNVEYSTDTWTVEGCDFLSVDKITIPLIQGTGDTSPLNGVQVNDVIGVVTQVCFLQAHNRESFTTPVPEENSAKAQVISDDGFYMQLLPNINIDGLKADGNPSTSDGIFVSTRDLSGVWGESAWLSSCLIDGEYPKPGDIVRVSGVVIESQKADRFGESRGLKTRTQINASSVVRDTSIVSEGFVDVKDDNLLKLTYTKPTGNVDQDSYRVVPFNDKGDGSLERASNVFESCEGMLVKIENPIVIGACYYNTTPVLADGGKQVNASGESVYPDQFNEKWLGNVVQEDDFNTEVIITYYDSLDNGTNAQLWKALPQIGTVLTDDSGAKVFRGVMDYNDNVLYMIYPLRKANLNTKNIIPGGYMDYSHLKFPAHDDFKFALNDEVSADSLYMMGDRSQQDWIFDMMGAAQTNYKAWKSGEAANPAFVVPETWTEDDAHMNVAVFNVENFVAEGARYRKYQDVVDVFVNNLKLPDLVFFVEMGDQDSSDDTIPYRNSGFSQNNLTGVVAARLNYETIIKKIKLETGIQYDYRQIDPVEYSQAGSPGNNIRVGFMFRTDRIEAYDIGLPTIHMEGLPGSDYKIPDNLKDGHKSLIFRSNGSENTSTSLTPGALDSEPSLTLETKRILAETHADVLVESLDSNGKVESLTLSQSPGFIQDDRFYNSRLPLICKFKFKPANGGKGEDFFAIALHLYSKGRDDKLYGSIQPPVMTSEIRRAGQSMAIKEYLDHILALDPNAKIIVGGDVNDFGFTYPIKKMTGEIGGNRVLYSMANTYMPENERFTYVFNGNLQQLDHIFVSPALYEGLSDKGVRQQGDDSWKNHVFVPHVDSLFSRDRHIQISDHDPIAARIDI